MELRKTWGTFSVFSIRRGRGACWSSEMGLGKVTNYSLTRTCIQPTNKLVSSHSRAPLVLGQATSNSSGLTWLTTAQIWGKPPPSPHIVYSMPLRAEWLFVPGLPRSRPKTVPVWTPGTLHDHNSLLKPLIGMRFEAKL
jgi:hypothetical protein